jgi:glycosyltransferase involved in cell wall biosynthesis
MKVSAIVNCSYEGLILKPALASALLSIEASGFAQDCELIVVADCANKTTLAVLESYRERLSAVLRTDHGDLGMARNAGAAAARGELVLFLDGDDLWSRNWVGAAWDAHRESPEQTILHPQLVMRFGGCEPEILVQPDWRDPYFDPRGLVARNHWISLCGVRRDLLIEIPYSRADALRGFGFEDWSWYAETVARGLRHAIVPDTVHFIRQKRTHSMQVEMAGFDRIPSFAFAEYLAADDASRPYDL